MAIVKPQSMTHVPVQKRLYSIPEACIYLGRSEWSVRRLIWAGELATVRVGRRVHVDIKDMDAFIDHHKEIEVS